MIVVTGGLGFIGNEIVRQLVNEGKSVTIIDNHNRVAPRLDDLTGVPRVDIDITDFSQLSGWMKERQVQKVFHMAAIHYIPECNENPERTLRINVEGTQSVLRASAEAGVKKFVFASSGAVYADSNEPLKESSLISPVDVYGWSKWFGEQLCQLNYQQFEMPIVIARLFNNYGPRETNPHIIPEILNQLRKGSRLSLGKITTVRDYIHTKDCASSLIKLADKQALGITHVNVATGRGYTVQQLIEMIGEILGRKIEVQHDSHRVRRFDKQTQVADIGLLRKTLNWEPAISIEEGLKDLLKFENLK